MRKKTKAIPVNPLAEEFDAGIAIGKISSGNLQSFEEANQAHRHNYHIFLLAEKGTANIEIDFEKHLIKSPSFLYIHPNQVHRILEVGKADFYLSGIINESLHPEYLKLLEQIIPAKPLSLKNDVFSVAQQALLLCIRIFEKRDIRLYPSILKDACNTLVGLMISQYLELEPAPEKQSRYDLIAKTFRQALERNFTFAKRPSDYAQTLNISTAYLNECVRNATGFSVSHHIQQRVVLEAKRLLYHSDKSVKEIAAELEYDDAAYFSRFFTKATGMSPLAFRIKNLV